MGSTSDNLKLPFIDFSEATEPGTAAWAVVRARVWKAMVEFGCFEAGFDRVPLDLRNATFRVLGELFELPLETKLQNTSTNSLNGYIGQRPDIPLFESMGIDDAVVLEKVDAFVCTFWPEGRPDFSKTLQSCSEKLSELDKTIRRMILESFGVEKYLEEHLSSTNYLLRVMKYNSPKTTDMMLGLDEHTDKPMISILYQDQQVQGALEIKTKDGNWIKYKPLHESFIVLLGDSFHAWANGRLTAPIHRVVMTGNKERYSIAQFSTPKPGIIINTPEELVDDEHPRLFKPFDYTKYTHQFIQSEQGVRARRDRESQLKAYCGV